MAAKGKREKKQGEGNFFGMMTMVMLAILFIVTGALMLFAPDMKDIYFLYVTGGILLAAGAWLVFRFFLKKGYREITNYDFSAGILILALGIVIMARAADLTDFFTFLLSLLLLVEAAILLQTVVQIIGLSGKAWPLPLVTALFVLAIALLSLTGYKNIFTNDIRLFYGFLFASGILGLICLIAAAGRNHSFRKEEEAKERQKTEDIEADYVITEPAAPEQIEDKKDADKGAGSGFSKKLFSKDTEKKSETSDSADASGDGTASGDAGREIQAAETGDGGLETGLFTEEELNLLRDSEPAASDKTGK